MMYSDDELLALSGLQHMAYCPRQWGLIHIDQVWEDSADTLRGDYFHERVDLRGYSTKRGVRAERRVHVVSHALGLYGVADVVEYEDTDDGLVVRPVEYKVGAPKANDWDRLQVVAQALCLEEGLRVSISNGAIFYGETRRREAVEISDKLRRKAGDLAERMHELAYAATTPPPVMTAKCRRCSLLDICMPESAALDAKEYWHKQEKKMVTGDEKAS